MQEWNDPKSIPKDGTEVLVCINFSNYKCLEESQIDIAKFDGSWEGYTYNIHEEDILGWIPIPKLLKIEHSCVSESKEIMCTKFDGKMALTTPLKDKEFVCFVNFCPFCGIEFKK